MSLSVGPAEPTEDNALLLGTNGETLSVLSLSSAKHALLSSCFLSSVLRIEPRVSYIQRAHSATDPPLLLAFLTVISHSNQCPALSPVSARIVSSCGTQHSVRAVHMSIYSVKVRHKLHPPHTMSRSGYGPRRAFKSPGWSRHLRTVRTLFPLYWAIANGYVLGFPKRLQGGFSANLAGDLKLPTRKRSWLPVFGFSEANPEVLIKTIFRVWSVTEFSVAKPTEKTSISLT